VVECRREKLLGKVTLGRLSLGSGWVLSDDIQLHLYDVTSHLDRRNGTFDSHDFGTTRHTFDRWLRRYDPRELAGLEDCTRRPIRRLQPTWTATQAEAVVALRRNYLHR
jgi:hypothetical protein